MEAWWLKSSHAAAPPAVLALTRQRDAGGGIRSRTESAPGQKPEPGSCPRWGHGDARGEGVDEEQAGGRLNGRGPFFLKGELVVNGGWREAPGRRSGRGPEGSATAARVAAWAFLSAHTGSQPVHQAVHSSSDI